MRYTSALLAAIPRIDGGRRGLPVPIGGLPPDLVSPPAGCRFAPRCAHAVDSCLTEQPPLTGSAETGHAYACWNPEPVPADLPGVTR